MSIPLKPGRPSGIVWIASFPRSGNTWMRSQILNLKTVLAGAQAPAPLTSLHDFCPSELSRAFFVAELGRGAEKMTDRQIARARPKVQMAIAQKAIGFAFLKTHAGRFTDEKAPTINPEASAGAIYLVRNPLDVTISYARHFDISVDLAIDGMAASGFVKPQNSKTVHQLIGSWSENVASWTTGDDRVLVIRYEDAVADRHKTLDAVARHVSIPATPLEIARAVDFSSFERLQADEAAHGFAERPDTSSQFFREGRSGQWREILSPSQVDRIVAAHGQQMERFGYLP